jgi:hypothetical protein
LSILWCRSCAGSACSSSRRAIARIGAQIDTARRARRCCYGIGVPLRSSRAGGALAGVIRRATRAKRPSSSISARISHASLGARRPLRHLSLAGRPRGGTAFLVTRIPSPHSSPLGAGRIDSGGIAASCCSRHYRRRCHRSAAAARTAGEPRSRCKTVSRAASRREIPGRHRERRRPSIQCRSSGDQPCGLENCACARDPDFGWVLRAWAGPALDDVKKPQNRRC